MAVSRRDCATRRGGHCVTNTGSGFSCVISTITNREYAGDQRQLPIRKHREERENGIASAVPFSHFSVDAVTFDISKTPIPL